LGLFISRPVCWRAAQAPSLQLKGEQGHPREQYSCGHATLLPAAIAAVAQ
jgi:hypothetical protein